MNAAEALTICRLAKAACPQQAVDEFTPEAWEMLLEPYRFEDARESLVNHCRVKPFVAPADIIAGVKEIRLKRLRGYGDFEPPSGLDTPEYLRYMSDMKRRIMDGDVIGPVKQLGLYERDLAIIEGTFREVKP